jgi:hypothetical protein
MEESKYETKYETTDKTLKKIETPKEIIPNETSYNIDEIQKKIDKIDNAIAQWEAKKAPLQEIINKHKELWQDIK